MRRVYTLKDIRKIMSVTGSRVPETRCNRRIVGDPAPPQANLVGNVSSDLRHAEAPLAIGMRYILLRLEVANKRIAKVGSLARVHGDPTRGMDCIIILTCGLFRPGLFKLPEPRIEITSRLK